MELQANENILEEESSQVSEGVGELDVEQLQPVSQRSNTTDDAQSKEKIKVDRKKYGKKFSARLYKYFTLLTFLVYYLNCMLRIAMRCSKYFTNQGIKNFSQWFKFMLDSANWEEIGKEIFDWYTITLLVFLLLYAIVFMITFIRFSPKHKKTFKYFKKGFLMARRVIKLISVALTLTVLINSAQLATFGDKFMFVISLCSIIFTFMQICVSIASWILGKKLNKSVKQYVGNVMTNYISASRTRPLEGENGNGTVGDKLSVAKDRFLRTIETLTLTKEEAMQRDAELSGYAIDNDSITERFENDYKESDTKENTLGLIEKKKPKRVRRSIIKDKHVSKSAKTKIVQKKPRQIKSKADSKQEAACEVVKSDKDKK